jgi:tripartite-type tricarboxylate transporter receptor subunit TctC
MSGRFVAASVIALLAFVWFSTPAHAQDWPQRPVRLIAPYAAGGNSDVIARMTAQRLGEAFGQSFIVENRLGGNGAIAAEAVARAIPDGYTLLWGATPPLTINPALARLSYDPVKDFAPISIVASNAFVLVVNKDFPPRTLAEFTCARSRASLPMPKAAQAASPISAWRSFSIAPVSK